MTRGSALVIGGGVAGALDERRLAFAGDYLGGPLVEGAVTSVKAAVKKLLTQTIG